MIFQPGRFQSEPSGSGRDHCWGSHELNQPSGLYREYSPQTSGDRLPLHNRLTDRTLKDSGDRYSDEINGSRILGFKHGEVLLRGEAVLSAIRGDIERFFPQRTFIPSEEHIAFRAALLEAAQPNSENGGVPHQMVRYERIHRALGLALANLVDYAAPRPLHKLSLEDGPAQEIGTERAFSEFLASQWVVRSFIRVASAEPETFQILISEMATIHSHYGRFTIGAPWSQRLTIELFNAATRNPELSADVIKGFELIGFPGAIGQKLFADFSALLKQ